MLNAPTAQIMQEAADQIRVIAALEETWEYRLLYQIYLSDHDQHDFKDNHVGALPKKLLSKSTATISSQSNSKTQTHVIYSEGCSALSLGNGPAANCGNFSAM